MGSRSLSFSGKRFLRGALCLLAIFLFCLSYWIHRYFGQLDVNQIAYHLNFGVDIVRTSDPVFTKRFVRWCVLAPFVFLLLLVLAFGWRTIHGTPPVTPSPATPPHP